MNVLLALGFFIAAVVNLVVVAWATFVVLQVQSMRRGELDKDDGDVIGFAKDIYERYFEPRPPEAT